MSDLRERLFRRVVKTPGCWNWTGGVDKPTKANPRTLPYGNIGTTGNRKTKTHRASWEIHFGPIPGGLFVLHRCDNPRCVRPDHLFLGTQGDNIRDREAKGRGNSANTKKVVCKRGHALVGSNVYHRPDRPWTRDCRICRNRGTRRTRRTEWSS